MFLLDEMTNGKFLPGTVSPGTNWGVATSFSQIFGNFGKPTTEDEVEDHFSANVWRMDAMESSQIPKALFGKNYVRVLTTSDYVDI